MPKKEKSLAIVEPKNYAIMQGDPQQFIDVLKDNCQGGLTPLDLDSAPVPSGGGTMWSIPDLKGEAETTSDIVGVCVLFQDVRRMWEEGYGEGDSDGPPDCQSSDLLVGVGDPGGSCAVCPLARFGSHEKGRAQKCQHRRMLFVMRPEIRLPLVINLPPTSLKACRDYFMRLAMRKSVPYYGVVSKLSLENEKGPGGLFSKVQFSLASTLEGDEKDAFQKLQVTNTPAE